MRAYKEISVVESECEAKAASVFQRRKLHIFSLFLVFCLTFSCLGVSLSTTGVSLQIKNITSYWSPNLSELGKLKYVDTDQSEAEVMSLVCDFSLPFKTNYATELDDGSFLVNGLGGLVVKCCMSGKVESVINENNVKAITISHGNNLKTVYADLDYVGVRAGDSVEKNTPLGICNDSKVIFKILYKNKMMAGLTIKDGELSFL